MISIFALFTLLYFFFGLIIGSFLNVVICRFNTQKSFGGRSVCMSCRTELSWYDLIPVLSFFALLGRCRTCKTKISAAYPIVEMLAGLIFALLFWKFQNVFLADTLIFAFTYSYYAVMFSLLLVIAVYDLRHKIIPNTFSFVFGFLAFVGLFLFSNYIFDPHIPAILEFLSGVFVALPFALFWLLSGGRWMGLGDAKLMLGLGWFLSLRVALSALAIGVWSGALVGVALIVLSGRYNMKSQIPFAPYLIAGAFVAFIFGLNLFQVGL